VIMNFLDALRTGAPFRRKRWINWWMLSKPSYSPYSGVKIRGGWESTSMSTTAKEPDNVDDWTCEDYLAEDFETRPGWPTT
jgi:hypothetical protein